jgi:HTH-type transcriptional regulator/antitoxin HipB
MKIELNNLPQLANLLESERKRQKLTRAQAAAVCNVSPSFIRDAETQPERCTLGKLVQLVNGLGLTMSIKSRSQDASMGIIASARQDARSERATGGLITNPIEARVSDAVRPSTGRGIINSARQRSGKEK